MKSTQITYFLEFMEKYIANFKFWIFTIINYRNFYTCCPFADNVSLPLTKNAKKVMHVFSLSFFRLIVATKVWFPGIISAPTSSCGFKSRTSPTQARRFLSSTSHEYSDFLMSRYSCCCCIFFKSKINLATEIAKSASITYNQDKKYRCMPEISMYRCTVKSPFSNIPLI